MNSNKIESINILLLLISLVTSFFLPFELFLFVYAILGPLHYCTEISWLYDKNLFIKNKKDVIPILIICFLFILSLFIGLPFHFTNNIFILMLISSGFISFYSVKNKSFSFFTILYFIIVYFLIYQINFIYLFIYYIVGTLLHVYVFTGFFMLSGNLKRDNKIGHLGFFLYLLAPIICFLIPYNNHLINEYFQTNFLNIFKNFFVDWFHYFNFFVDETQFFKNELIQKFSRFISFAYTYHYLNWFSKTNIIGWNNISNKRRFFIIFIWIFSISSYAYNYMFGYFILLFLSFLHVLLEFPLNWISIFDLFNLKKTK